MTTLTNAVSEAASAPAVKISGVGTVVAAAASAPDAVKGASTAGEALQHIVEWVLTGPGLVAVAGLVLTVLTFLFTTIVNLWTAWKREQRAGELHRLKVQRLSSGMPLPPGIESDRVDLDE